MHRTANGLWYDDDGNRIAPPPAPPSQMDRIESLLMAILAALKSPPLPTVPYEQVAAMMDAPSYDPLAGLRTAAREQQAARGDGPTAGVAPSITHFDNPALDALIHNQGAWFDGPTEQVEAYDTQTQAMQAIPLPPARPAGSLHMIGPLSDPIGTPGAVHPDYTEADIDKTIRVGGWTSTVRPPTSYTTPLKQQMMVEYGYPPGTDPATLELDHKVPLCVLGHPTSPLNLYPQPREGQWGAKTKDICEVMAQHAVLNGLVSLDTVQKGFMSDWTVLYSSLTHNPKLMASMMMMSLSPPEDEP